MNYLKMREIDGKTTRRLQILTELIYLEQQLQIIKEKISFYQQDTNKLQTG